MTQSVQNEHPIPERESSITHYLRACEQIAEIIGHPIGFTGHIEDSAMRYKFWCVDSIAFALKNVGSDPVLCLRATLQAADYVGRCRGYWPSPVIGDAYIFLKNSLEDRLRPRS